jgi:FHS family L-fucose permease-like MFS transporter
MSRDLRLKLTLLCGVYLVWGAIASLNDLLIPYLKQEFGLTFSGAMRVQLVFYAAYFFLSVPFGLFLRRVGFRNGILTGLGGALVGCLLMAAASRAGSYGLILAAVFVIASGITLLQVSANPYATSLGAERTAPSRLTLVQSFHSLGTTIGPWFGAVLLFAVAWSSFTDGDTPGQAIAQPYLILALALGLLAIFFWRTETGGHRNITAPSGSIVNLVRAHPQLLYSTLAIFCYVGAEIAIASFLVNYLVMPGILGLEHATAGKLVSVYWGCALAGRFAGIFLLRIFPPRRMLVFYACAASMLVAASLASSGLIAAASLLLIGVFNSIMFPTIFALTINRFPDDSSAVSGLLCLGIVGGAVISQLQGLLADSIGLQASFILPLACYLYIVFFSLRLLNKISGTNTVTQ